MRLWYLLSLFIVVGIFLESYFAFFAVELYSLLRLNLFILIHPLFLQIIRCQFMNNNLFNFCCSVLVYLCVAFKYQLIILTFICWIIINLWFLQYKTLITISLIWFTIWSYWHYLFLHLLHLPNLLRLHFLIFFPVEYHFSDFLLIFCLVCGFLLNFQQSFLQFRFSLLNDFLIGNSLPIVMHPQN